MEYICTVYIRVKVEANNVKAAGQIIEKCIVPNMNDLVDEVKVIGIQESVEENQDAFSGKRSLHD